MLLNILPAQSSLVFHHSITTFNRSRLIMARNYSVVEFPSEQLVSVVPSSWLMNKDENCRWPTAIGTRLSKLIKDQAVPLNSWNIYSCRVLKDYRKWHFILVMAVILLIIIIFILLILNYCFIHRNIF
jgi:hypothetical protein